MNILRSQKWMIAFKAAVFVLMSWFIINRLFLANDIQEQWQVFTRHLQGANTLYLLLAIALMPVNWLLETIKWRWLIRSKAPFVALLKSVIAGITLGFVTPARSGEFIGRVMLLDDEDKAKVFYLSIVGGIAHTVVTLTAGALCVAVWSSDPFFAQVATGAAAVFILFYFRYDVFNRLITAIPFLKRNNLILHSQQLPAFDTQLKVLGITYLRYGVYVSQYVALFLFFGTQATLYALFVHAGVFFLFHAFSPLMPFLDFSFRGALVILIFNELSSNNLALISTVTLAWVLNLVIPALIGYLFILKRRTWLKVAG